MTLPTTTNAKSPADEQSNDEVEKRRSAVKASSKGAGQRTRHLFSCLFGQSTSFGKQRSLKLRDRWHQQLVPKIEKTGIPLSSPQPKNKAKKSGPAHTELQREMFSKAASRVAQIITKQRQQEADRIERKRADEKLTEMENSHSFDAALLAIEAYREEYRIISEATGEFLIRPAQLSGWVDVVTHWDRVTEPDPVRAIEERIEAVKRVQTSYAEDDKKFGDANLFFRLADELYKSAWRLNSKADATILERYIQGMKARSDSERLKVAAYRHADACRSPVFCQFGVSRPPIKFRRLKRFDEALAAEDPRAVGMLLWHPAVICARLTLMYAVSTRLDREIGTACEQVHHGVMDTPAVSRRGRLGAAAGGLPKAASPARVAGVFDIRKVEARSLSDDEDDDGDDDNEDERLKEPTWNGTLSADRRELEAISKLIDRGDLQRAEHRRKKLRWTLTVSMRMEGRGPWFEYVANAEDAAPFIRTVRKDKYKNRKNDARTIVALKGDKFIDANGWPWQEFNKPLKENKDATVLNEDAKAARGNNAYLILSRLPGLRVLSVDLGHRFAAACAVWESLSLNAMEHEIDGREVVAGGMGEHDLYCHTRHIERDGKERIRIYRRIGNDRLGNSPHPAPWARLDRQFFIKLQGEQWPARAASNKSEHGVNEVAMVADLAKALGLKEEAEAFVGRSVDELMRCAVRIATLGMYRHGRRAKIAYAFNPKCPGIPGIAGKLKKIVLGGDAHVRFLTDALIDWHALATDTNWDGSATRELWRTHIGNRFEIDDPSPRDANADPLTRQQQREFKEQLRERLTPLAELFARNEASATEAIFTAWQALWKFDDGEPAMVPELLNGMKGPPITVVAKAATGWYARIRILTDWIMGWHLSGIESNRWNRHVGGLSLTRIATMKSLYQLQKAFSMRPRPQELRGAPDKGESNAGVAQSILDAIDRLREQRVKQIASRIVESALGVGKEHRRERDEIKSKWRYAKRPQDRLYYVDENGRSSGDSRFAQCHAVVIENLRNYRPDELQVRRENRQLMNWSAGKVRKYLEEGCQLHGLHLREVTPNYTSRQDSRTAAPGIRCKDFAVSDFVEQRAYIGKRLRKALKRLAEGSTDKECLYIGKLLSQWNREERTWIDADGRHWVLDRDGRWLGNDGRPQEKGPKYRCPRPIRLPTKSGDLFVSADARHNSASAIQADLNAAANIGLRALLDPDFAGKWWYIPVVMDNEGWRVPRPESFAGVECMKDMKLGQKDGYFCREGSPLVATDDESVKRVKEEYNLAKKNFDSIKKAAKKGGADQSALIAAEKCRNEAKARWKDEEKAAKQKPVINIWRDPNGLMALSAERWHESNAYWNLVRARIIGYLAGVCSNSLSKQEDEAVAETTTSC